MDRLEQNRDVQLMTPLAAAFVHVMSRGFAEAAQRYDLSLAVANQFNPCYNRTLGPMAPSAMEVAPLGQRAEAKLWEAMEVLEERWQETWVPQIQGHLEALVQMEATWIEVAQIPVLLENILMRVQDLWRIRFEVLFPSRRALAMFTALYQEFFDAQDPLDAHTLLQGLDDETRQKTPASIAEARHWIQGFPIPAVVLFEYYLKAAQEAVVIDDNLNTWIDSRLSHHLRRLLRVMGERLVEAEILAEWTEILTITLAELHDAVQGKRSRQTLLCTRSEHARRGARSEQERVFGDGQPAVAYPLFDLRLWTESI